MLEVGYFGAVVAGILSFLSPCILPIVPFYLSYMAGVGMEQVRADGGLPPGIRARAVAAALAFSAGVIVIFVGLGLSANAFGQMLRDWFDVLRWLAAGLIIAMGLHFLGVIRIGLLYRQMRAEAGDMNNLSIVGAFVVGLAFAFGWTPCVGPVLAAILFTAAAAQDAWAGGGLLLAYGIGMTAPFVLAALFVGPFLRWMARFRRHLPVVEKVMGGLLVLFGLLIATNTVNVIAQWMVETFPVFMRIG